MNALPRPCHLPAPPCAFKEWSMACEALESGTQAIILRKGGIAEGKNGFGFDREFFFLLPTYFHDQVAQMTLPPPADPLPQGHQPFHRISLLAKLIFAAEICEWGKVLQLEGMHHWKEETLRERFYWKEANLIHLALVQVFRLVPEWIVPDSPQLGGCKSWVDLPSHPPSTTMYEPILDNGRIAELALNLKEKLA